MKRELKNRLLKHLPESEMPLLLEQFQKVDLLQGEELYDRRNLVDYVYFPEDSMISLISETQDGSTVVVGVVGSEGVLGAGAIFDRNKIPYRATVQAGGKAYRARPRVLRKMFLQPGDMQHRLLSYFLTIHMQAAQSAACNRFHSVQERLAKWLLLSVDRTGRTTFGYTQEFLSMILGARRTTVSRTLSLLEKSEMIRTGRASVTVLQPKQLETVACECYRLVRDEFAALN